MSDNDSGGNLQELTRLDDSDETEIGAFEDFEPINPEEETNAVEDHDCYLDTGSDQ